MSESKFERLAMGKTLYDSLHEEDIKTNGNLRIKARKEFDVDDTNKAELGCQLGWNNIGVNKFNIWIN